MSDEVKSVPSISVSYARTGASTNANALGMRPMQERGYEKHHFPATISDLNDPGAMPEDLRQAHQRNDEVLERSYIGQAVQERHRAT